MRTPPHRNGALAKAPALLLCVLLALALPWSAAAAGADAAPEPGAAVAAPQHATEEAGGPHGVTRPGAEPSAQEASAERGSEESSANHGAEEASAEHGAEEEAGHVELPNWILLLQTFVLKDPHSRAAHWIHVFENSIFAMSSGLVLTLLAVWIYRRRQEMPGRAQAFAEIVVEQVDKLVQIVIGPQGRSYTPFVGTLFLYILFMNYSALIPLGKAPTATFLNNISLALVVFFYVQYTGIRKNGVLGYLHHLAGSPRDVVGWALSPLMMFLEIFGELIKPVSLSLRLFGNIFGEDMLLAIFAALGAVLLSFLPVPVGIPFHVPFMLLSLLLGFIQAMVFALLATVYISLMLPHAEHGGGEHGHAGHGQGNPSRAGKAALEGSARAAAASAVEAAY